MGARRARMWRRPAALREAVRHGEEGTVRQSERLAKSGIGRPAPAREACKKWRRSPAPAREACKEWRWSAPDLAIEVPPAVAWVAYAEGAQAAALGGGRRTHEERLALDGRGAEPRWERGVGAWRRASRASARAPGVMWRPAPLSPAPGVGQEATEATGCTAAADLFVEPPGAVFGRSRASPPLASSIPRCQAID